MLVEETRNKWANDVYRSKLMTWLKWEGARFSLHSSAVWTVAFEMGPQATNQACWFEAPGWRRLFSSQSAWKHTAQTNFKSARSVCCFTLTCIHFMLMDWLGPGQPGWRSAASQHSSSSMLWTKWPVVTDQRRTLSPRGAVGVKREKRATGFSLSLSWEQRR